MTVRPRQRGRPVRLAKRRTVAAYLDLSENTVDTWVARGWLPAPRRVGGLVLWDLEAVDAAVDALFDGAEAGPAAASRCGGRHAATEGDGGWDG